MHLNKLAGRTFNDLTQYPVFPHVVADMSSSELDLHNRATFRDLRRPMGALSAEREAKARERFEQVGCGCEMWDVGLAAVGAMTIQSTRFSVGLVLTTAARGG